MISAILQVSLDFELVNTIMYNYSFRKLLYDFNHLEFTVNLITVMKRTRTVPPPNCEIK